MTEYAYGEQSPTGGETPVAWSGFVDVDGNAIKYDSDYGYAALAPGECAFGPVVDAGSSALRWIEITRERYGTGNGLVHWRYRYSDAPFSQTDTTPVWNTYSSKTTKTYRYLQISATGIPINVVGIGDSFGLGNSMLWPDQLGGHSYLSVTNACVSGNRLDQMRDRFAADVIALNPNLVIIQGGINDVLWGRLLAWMEGAMQTMVADAIAARISVALINIGPFGNSDYWNQTRQTKVEDYNTWLDGYATANNLPLTDMYTALRDGINLAAGYDSDDGLHPNYAAGTLLKGLIEQSLGSFFSESA